MSSTLSQRLTEANGRTRQRLTKANPVKAKLPPYRFVPSNESTKVVVDCVKAFYRDAWNKCSDIPYIYRDQMWNQFRTRCAWFPKYHQQISHNFKKKGSDRLKNMLYKARLEQKIPS
nr:uncharacterized protein LOC108947418 [Nicotiana tomentosiformis]